MPDDLREISGIAFRNGKSDSLFAEEDENGRVYYLKLGDKNAAYTTFKESGDFEDIAICDDHVVMLQSSGVLFTFPLSEIRKQKPDHVNKIEDMLPEGEYEGMCADDKGKLLYVLCKHCSDDKTSENSSGYIFKLSADGSVQKAGKFNIDVKNIESLTGVKKIKFHPSALAHNNSTNEWFVLSSVNKLLVTCDEDWKVKAVYKLDEQTFPQPEGMAFDEQNNLYISNEGQGVTSGNVLKFTYKGVNG